MTASFEVRAVTDFIGAEIRGLDLKRPVSTDDTHALNAALDQHGFLLFRGQPLSPSEQAAFCKVFGDLDQRTIRKFGRGDEPVHYVSNVREAGDFHRGALSFHIDQLFYEDPNYAVSLHAVEVTKEGGETTFARSGLEYESLPRDLREKLSTLTAVHFLDFGQIKMGDVWPRSETLADLPPDVPRATHPVVFTHPRTGKKALWICITQTLHLMEMSRSESDDFLAALLERINTTKFQYHHKWEAGETIVWSNWSLHHGRLPFRDGEARTLQRVPINSRTGR